MNLIIFTDNSILSDLFEKTQFKFDNREVNITIYSVNEIDSKLEGIYEDEYCYFDVSDLKPKQIDAFLKKIQINKVNAAFIDLKGKIKDPASLIFKGIFDYLGKGLLKKFIQSEEIDISRIESAISFCKNKLAATYYENREKELEKELGFCSKWNEIEEGKEYFFWILFVSVDGVEQLKESMRSEYRKYLFSKFKEFVRKTVKKGNGRIWMWNEHGGIVLFPYDGVSMDAVASSIRLILNRKIFNYELKDSFDLSYRVALHKGKTVYKERGKTGTIISDDINKVFHLGLDFADKPGFYITNTAMELLPVKADCAFEDLGNYEGLRIFKFYDYV